MPAGRGDDAEQRPVLPEGGRRRCFAVVAVPAARFLCCDDDRSGARHRRHAVILAAVLLRGRSAAETDLEGRRHRIDPRRLRHLDDHDGLCAIDALEQARSGGEPAADEDGRADHVRIAHSASGGLRARTPANVEGLPWLDVGPCAEGEPVQQPAAERVAGVFGMSGWLSRAGASARWATDIVAIHDCIAPEVLSTSTRPGKVNSIILGSVPAEGEMTP